nr:TauD/TfdA family dioxygenase [Streptomyces sp. 846.5]
MPIWYRRAAADFRERLGNAGVLRISGLPIPERLQPTPTVPSPGVRRAVGTEAALLAFAMLLGRTIGFADWHGGDQVQNMYPVPGEAERQNASNAVLLELHTETAFRPDTPDAVLLLCLREDPDASTLFCDLRGVWEGMSAPDRVLLREPGYAFRMSTGELTPAKPVVAEDGRGTRFNYAEALVGTRVEYAQVLRRLNRAIATQCFEVTLRTGELLVVDNMHMIHGRTAYAPRYDGSDRWLQRCLVRGGNGADEEVR